MRDAATVDRAEREEAVGLLYGIILGRLQKGYHERGHHPSCATGADDGCDCYARNSYLARMALAELCDLALQDRELRRIGVA